jgi:hypothetical protein
LFSHGAIIAHLSRFDGAEHPLKYTLYKSIQDGAHS